MPDSATELWPEFVEDSPKISLETKHSAVLYSISSRLHRLALRPKLVGVCLTIAPRTAYTPSILEYCTVLRYDIPRQKPNSGRSLVNHSSNDSLKTMHSAVGYCTASLHRPALRPNTGRNLADDSSQDNPKTKSSAVLCRTSIVHRWAWGRKSGRSLVDDCVTERLKTGILRYCTVLPYYITRQYPNYGKVLVDHCSKDSPKKKHSAVF